MGLPYHYRLGLFSMNWRKRISAIFLGCCLLHLPCFHLKGFGDTISVALSNAYFVGSYVEIPVYFSSQGSVNALDLALRFDANRLQFDDIISPAPGLQYLYHTNPQDSVWRLTSYCPNAIDPLLPVFYLRLLTLDNEACAFDFSEEEGYLNGDACVITVLGCLSNTGWAEIHVGAGMAAYPNPFQNELHVKCPNGMRVMVMDMLGNMVEEALGPVTFNTDFWRGGIYTVIMIGGQSRITIRAVKLNNGY